MILSAKSATLRDHALQRPGHMLDAERLDDVADADVLVVLEGHAAFLADRHLRHFVLEAFESLQLAFVDDDARPCPR